MDRVSAQRGGVHLRPAERAQRTRSGVGCNAMLGSALRRAEPDPPFLGGYLKLGRRMSFPGEEVGPCQHANRGVQGVCVLQELRAVVGQLHMGSESRADPLPFCSVTLFLVARGR